MNCPSRRNVRGRQEGQNQRRSDDGSRGQTDMKKRSQAKESGGLYKTENARKLILPWSLQKEHGTTDRSYYF